MEHLYIDGDRRPCQNYEQIKKFLDTGTAARSVRGTNMNQDSSRAHTIFDIILKKTIPNPVCLSYVSLPDKVEKTKSTIRQRDKNYIG